jgi:thiamine-monophosphate kinase
VAALDAPRRGSRLLLTSDAFTEGFHFLPGTPPRLLGRAIVDVNASDLAAKGGLPLAFLLDLGLRPGTRTAWARALVGGVRAELRRWGGRLVGGDTKPSDRTVVAGMFLGRSSSRRLAPRSGARPGDALLLTGTVGGPGWVARRRRSRPPRARSLRELLEIRPRLREGRELVRVAHAMLDTSDGFAESARILSAASRCRIVVEEDALPFDRRLNAAILDAGARLELAAYGGEYELMAAVPPRAVPRETSSFRRRGLAPLHRIGRVEKGSGAWLERGGELRPLPPSPWQPWV